MKWKRFTIHTHVDAVDILSYELDAIGFEGIEIEDHKPLSEEDKKKMFVDILPDPEVVDDVALVHFYVEESDAEDTQAVCAKVQAILDEIREYTEIGEGLVTVSETEDKDWINNWKEFFHAFRASDRIAVAPTWEEEIPEEVRKGNVERIIRIDPGVAFGTGAHETTKLCIRALDAAIHGGERVFDIGCGSGILSTAALMLGASHVTAIDIDETAVRVAKGNFDINGLDPASYELLAGNLLADRKIVSGSFDIITANILPDVIVPLTKIVPDYLKDGGLYITSGILKERAGEVREAMEQNGFRDIKETPMGEWVCITALLN